MKKRNIIRYILLPLFVIIAAGAIYIYKEYNRTQKDTARLKTDYSVSAATLIREFESDEHRSNEKYWDKVLRVAGRIKDVIRDEKGFSDVILGDTVSMSSVRCSIDSLHTHETVSLRKGDSVIVKGICSGFNADELLGSDVILVRSIIDKEK